MFSSAFASKLNTKLDIIQQFGEKKYLENNQGYISKTIVDLDANARKVTIDLSLKMTEETIKSNQKAMFTLIGGIIAIVIEIILLIK